VRVLLSNDDGVHAAGLRALAAAFEGGDEVWVVAPDREQSASSHSISLHRPLRLSEVGPRRFAVDGTPTDAVYMGLNLVLREARPDVVLSGVNHGPPRSRCRSPPCPRTTSRTQPGSRSRWREGSRSAPAPPCC
jgi:5'-nucleotidase